jgi:hypothetical protein
MRASKTSPQLSPNLAPTTGLVVCERTDKWVAAWRRELGTAAVAAETRTVEDAAAALRERPHGAVALEIEVAQLPQMVAQVAHWQRKFPHIYVVAQLTSDMRVWTGLLREAGAALVLTSTREVPAAAQQLQQHFARAPRPALSLREELWQKLPWS